MSNLSSGSAACSRRFGGLDAFTRRRPSFASRYATGMRSSVVQHLGSTTAASEQTPALERRGRAWLLWSFVLCPCHLPISLGVLTALLAGTSVGASLRDHTWAAGILITVTWMLGTAYGFRLIRQAQRTGGACPIPQR